MSWDVIFEHLFIVLAASLLSIAVGLPLGIWAYVSRRIRPVILRIVDLLQTIPSLALLGIIMVVLDPGKLTVIIGITLYSLLPIVHNTCLGLQEVDPGVKEAAIENGTFDVAVVYTTDGLNRKVGLKVLEDDKSFFPDYFGIFVVRGDILEQYPELEGILEQLSGKISTDQMAELTYQVDVVGRTVDEVAQEFLVSLGLLSA